MFEIFRRRYQLVLFLVAAANGTGAAQAHQMLYNQNGYRLAVGIEAGLGGFRGRQCRYRRR
jgi:hypothetical protein